MEEHDIIYEGLPITVLGNWEEPDDTTGYKGGFATEIIKVNDVDIYWMLKPNIIEHITELVTEIR